MIYPDTFSESLITGWSVLTIYHQLRQKGCTGLYILTSGLDEPSNSTLAHGVTQTHSDGQNGLRYEWVH